MSVCTIPTEAERSSARTAGYYAGLAHLDGDPHPRVQAITRGYEIQDRRDFVDGYWLGKDARS